MKKEIILITGVLSFLLFVIFLNLLLADKFEVSTCTCPKMVSHNFVGFFVFLSIIFSVSLLYYLFSLKIENKEKIIKSNFDLLFSILNEQEKEIIQRIIVNKGSIEQSKISKTYGKLKTHRLIKKLEEKNIVEIVKHGKKNKIKLKEELKQELVK